MRREDAHEDIAAVLQARLHAADEQIVVPPGLWQRIQAPPTPADHTVPRRTRARLAVLASACVIVMTVCAIVTGTWWLTRHPIRVSAPASTVTLTVYNAEVPCRTLHTLECALHLARDPYAPYEAPGNSAGEVWHEDRVKATCVVTDATLIQDESGVTSTRWYLITTTNGTRGWLPGVRTRNKSEVRACTTAEVAATRPH
jgi:hypothetical protein